MKNLDNVLIFIGAIVFCVGFSALLAHSAEQRKAETQKIIMIDQNGHIIKELTIDELRKETTGDKHDNN